MTGAHSVLFVTSEMYPFSKSGGLGDVMGVLPLVLKDLGLEVTVLTPFYGRLFTSDFQIRLLKEQCPVGYPWPDVAADIYQADYFGVPVYFVDRPEYYDRKNFYCTYHGDYFDNCERFIFFSRAALSWAGLLDDPPDIVHAHDWHSALIPAYLHFMRQEEPFWRQTKTVMTIHNLAFQGQYSARLFWESGLPASAWNMDGAEYYGSFNMLKAGIAYADTITTVSPSYAQEILTPRFGFGLEGMLRKRAERLYGILNGVDYTIWDPGRDRFLVQAYDAEDLSGKQTCKMFLLEQMGLDPEYAGRPVLGFIGRLRSQKGIDLLLQIIPDLLQSGVGIIVLGEGDLEVENQLSYLVERYPGRISVCIGYTEEKSHQIMAGADIFLMPSRYEPCGLTQLYSLRYGTLPVTSTVGGLKDTVVSYPQPECTGFTFQKIAPESFLGAIETAVGVWKEQTQWKAMQKRAMMQDFSWLRSAREYIQIYSALTESSALG